MRPAFAADGSVRASCPQCGALLDLPYKEERLACSWCGSLLRPGLGIRVRHLLDHPRLDRAAAVAAFRGWSVSREMPPDLLRQAGEPEVGELDRFAFMRVKKPLGDDFIPLGPVPTPDVLLLAGLPADLRPPQTRDADPPRAPIMAEVLRDALAGLPRDGGVQEVFVEERAYYPAAYRYEGRRYTAVIDAAGGRVLAARTPGRQRLMGERLVAPPVAAVLFAEALFVPTLPGKAAAITLTAALLFALLRLAVARHG
jgi:hypothetical protein